VRTLKRPIRGSEETVHHDGYVVHQQGGDGYVVHQQGGDGMIDMKWSSKWIKQEGSQTHTHMKNRLLPSCRTYMGTSSSAAPRPVTTYFFFSAFLMTQQMHVNMYYYFLTRLCDSLVQIHTEDSLLYI
jgi:hypothetical protein